MANNYFYSPIYFGIGLFFTIFNSYSCPTQPLEALICHAEEDYQTLKLISEVILLTGTSIENSNEESKQKIKPLLTKARNAVFFNAKAGEALNDFYVSWLTFIEEMLPRSYEDLSAYQYRVDERYTVLQEKANRLRIAAE